MGTNYEWRDSPCEHCGRVDVVHVGKSSGGWSFLFRGYRHDPDDGYVSPLRVAIGSRTDWRRIFTERPGTLWDEYGRQVDDPIAWIDGRQPPDLARQQWEGAQYRPGEPPDPRDPEGFRVSFSDFF